VHTPATARTAYKYPALSPVPSSILGYYRRSSPPTTVQRRGLTPESTRWRPGWKHTPMWKHKFNSLSKKHIIQFFVLLKLSLMPLHGSVTLNLCPVRLGVCSKNIYIYCFPKLTLDPCYPFAAEGVSDNRTYEGAKGIRQTTQGGSKQGQ
jgi:hypothetical protein